MNRSFGDYAVPAEKELIDLIRLAYDESIEASRGVVFEMCLDSGCHSYVL